MKRDLAKLTNNVDKSYRVLFSKELTNDFVDLRSEIEQVKDHHLIYAKRKNEDGSVQVVTEIDDDSRFMEDLTSVINNTIIDSLKWKMIHAFFGADSTLKKLFSERQAQVEDLYKINSIENFLVAAAIDDEGKIVKKYTKIDDFASEAEIDSLLSNKPDLFLPNGLKKPTYVINQVKYNLKTRNKIIIEEYRQKRIGRFAEKLADYLFGLQDNLPSDLLGQRIQVSSDMLHETTKQLRKIADKGSYYPEWIVFDYKDSVGKINGKIAEAKRLDKKYSHRDPKDIPKEDRMKMLPRIEVDMMLNKYPVQTLVQDHASGLIYKEGVVSHENFYFSFRKNDREKKYSKEGLSSGAEHIENMVMRLLDVPGYHSL